MKMTKLIKEPLTKQYVWWVFHSSIIDRETRAFFINSAKPSCFNKAVGCGSRSPLYNQSMLYWSPDQPPADRNAFGVTWEGHIKPDRSAYPQLNAYKSMVCWTKATLHVHFRVFGFSSAYKTRLRWIKAVLLTWCTQFVQVQLYSITTFCDRNIITLMDVPTEKVLARF